MPVLELVIDARKAEQGAKQAETALRTVSREAANTQAAVGLAGQQINTAFSATSGGLSVTRGIVSTAQAFEQGSIAAAGFAASTALLDVSRLANDFSALRVSTSGTTSIMGTLATVIRSHPLLVIGTAIAAAATAMSLFSSNTKEAAKQMQDAQASADKFSASLSGIGAARASGGSTASAIQQIVQKIEADRRNEFLTFRTARSDRGSGAPTNLDNSGGPYAYLSDLDRQLPGTFSDFGKRYPDLISRGFLEGRLPPNQEVRGDYFISSQAFTDYLRDDRLPRERFREFASSEEFGASPGLDGFASSGLRRADERRQQAIEESRRNMEELIEKGREFGATIGDAFFNVASGAQTARQAIAGLVSDLARAASRQAFSNLFGSVVGATGSQARADGGASGSNIVLPD